MKWWSILFARTTHTIPHTHTYMLKTSFTPAVPCIWSVLENPLFQNRCCHDFWVLNLLGNQELNKHSQSTYAAFMETATHFTVITLPIQRWIVPMVWLQYKVLPSHPSSPALSTQGRVWPFKAASPAFSCICRAFLIPEVHDCNTSEFLWGLSCTKSRTITVNANITVWKFKQTHKGPFWNVSPMLFWF